MSLAPGAEIGPYRVIAPLGAGGMGEVYRAHDPRLGREVALKLLPEAQASDPERRRRLAQEARAASALDHPNVVAVYDVGEHEGVPFIVMQLVEGRPLRVRIGRMPVREAVSLGIQIADALAAAHARGIVHRDLKPENVVVTDRGVAKVLDFGLAKLVEGDWRETPTEDKDALVTRDGQVMGTVAYMSPEQAEGRPVDARSDLFSLGGVLYEMVTGARAFPGKSRASILSAILRDEPVPAGGLKKDVPAQLEQVLARALRKDPDRRFQSAADFRVALVEVLDEIDSESGRASGGVVRHWSRWWPWAAGVLGAAALTALGIAAWPRSKSAETLPPPRIVPLTSHPGEEQTPSLSPDGTRVAYAGKDEGATNFDLYVRLIDGGTELRLTDTPENEWAPTWSPDGSRIAFVRLRAPVFQITREETPIVAISSLGGPESVLGGTQASSYAAPSWSPDGGHISFVDRLAEDGPTHIALLATATGLVQALTQPPDDCGGERAWCGDHSPAFSPDGRSIAFTRTTNGWNHHVFAVDTRSRALTRLTASDDLAVEDVAWTADGSSLILSQPGYLHASLWRLPARGGDPQALNLGGSGATRAALSRQRDRLVFVTAVSDFNLWRASGPTATHREAPTRLDASTRDEQLPSYSPDGGALAFSSDRTGNFEIWRMGSDGRGASPVTAFGSGSSSHPAWSPDGRNLVFSRMDEGRRPSQVDLWRVAMNGGAPQRLTETAINENFPRWTRDGASIDFYSDGRLWRMPATGGPARPLTGTGVGYRSRESLDGRFLLYTKGKGVFRVAVTGGEETKLVEAREIFHFWDVYAGGFCYRDVRPDGTPVLKAYEFATGRARELTALEKKDRGGLTVSKDGRWVVYDQQDAYGSDLVLVEDFR